jgi:hypothetical protein
VGKNHGLVGSRRLTAGDTCLGQSWEYGGIDYCKLTGKVPTVVNGNHDDLGNNGAAQYDGFAVEMTSSAINK